MTTSKFLPFKNSLQPGAIILPMNSQRLVYLAVEDTKQNVDWQLKFCIKKSELAGP